MIDILPTTLTLEEGKIILEALNVYSNELGEIKIIDEFMFKLQEDINFVKESNKITEESLEIK